MLITRSKQNLLIQSILILSSLLIFLAPLHAGYSFSDTPTQSEQAAQKKIDKKDKKLSKKYKKLKSKFFNKERRDDYFGRLALISLGLAVLSSFLSILSIALIAGFFIGLIAALAFSILGVKHDKNPTKAQIVLFIYVLALVVLLSIIMISAIG